MEDKPAPFLREKEVKSDQDWVALIETEAVK
jgi:hypothetical protein